MSEEPRAILTALAVSCGYDLTVMYAEPDETRDGIRQIQVPPRGSQLNDLQRRALLQNLQLVILGTASAEGFIPSVAAQMNLYRWTCLRAVSPPAADAYAAVLRYLGLEPPPILLRGVEND